MAVQFPRSPDYYQRGSAWRPEDWSLSSLDLQRERPHITVGVLSFNRLPALRLTLDVLTHGVQYPEMEIIVVDNNSQDGSQEMLRRDFPHVKLIALDENRGTSARNLFRDHAHGTYLFNYDDDSMPATPATLARIVEYMEVHQDIDALFPMYYQPLSGFLETGEDHKFRLGGDTLSGYEGVLSVEGGACYRLSSFKKVDGYDERFIWGAEGLELAMQFYGKGLKMVLHDNFATLHMRSSIGRVDERNAYYRSRHTVWLLQKHFPAPIAMVLSFAYLLRRSVDLIKKPKIGQHSVKAVIDGLLGSKPFRQNYPKLTWAQIRELKRWYLGLLRW